MYALFILISVLLHFVFTQFCNYVFFLLFPVFSNCPFHSLFFLLCTLLVFFSSSVVYHFSGSQQGLVARRSLYSRHLDNGVVGLLDRHSTGKVK